MNLYKCPLLGRLWNCAKWFSAEHRQNVSFYRGVTLAGDPFILI